MPARLRDETGLRGPAMPLRLARTGFAREKKAEARQALGAHDPERPVLIVARKIGRIRPSLADDIHRLAVPNVVDIDPGLNGNGVAICEIELAA